LEHRLEVLLVSALELGAQARERLRVVKEEVEGPRERRGAALGAGQ
jgi:hypothetical protein